MRVCVSEMLGMGKLIGSITLPLSLLAGTVIGVVIYTGKETRSVLNTSYAKNKVNTCFYIIAVKNEHDIII